MKTNTKNIQTLVEKGIISVEMPKMGGILVVNGVEIDLRKYYEGRGSRYNKNINHIKVIVAITGKAIATSMRHYKMALKVAKLRKEASAKSTSKSNKDFYCGEMQYAFTKARKTYFPVIKEISRTKI